MKEGLKRGNFCGAEFPLMREKLSLRRTDSPDMQRAADFSDHAHITEGIGVVSIAIPCIKLGGKNKLFHQPTEDDLALLLAGKNLRRHLSCISKAGFALDTRAGANTTGTLWA